MPSTTFYQNVFKGIVFAPFVSGVAGKNSRWVNNGIDANTGMVK